MAKRKLAIGTCSVTITRVVDGEKMKTDCKKPGTHLVQHVPGKPQLIPVCGTHANAIQRIRAKIRSREKGVRRG